MIVYDLSVYKNKANIMVKDHLNGHISHGKYNAITYASSKELGERERLCRIFSDTFETETIPHMELMDNLGLFISRRNMSRILWIHELYKKIIEVHGVIIEFGVRWGQNLALFESFRGIYEPFNWNRKIVGFDTFEGFMSLDKKDGSGEIMKEGSYDVLSGYEHILEQILDHYESESPMPHIRNYELVKGDATVTAKQYFSDNPHTIVALAYFDFDIYKPTYECLKIISEHVTKGSIIAFDELNHKDFPGETLALKEIFGLNKYAIKRVPYNPQTSYLIVE